MQTRRSLWLVLAFGLVQTMPGQEAQRPDSPGSSAGARAAPPAGAPTIDELIARLQEREQAAKTVMLRMRSRTNVPEGPVFETEGTLRVLGTTHFHVAMKMKAGNGMEGENEVVRTPAATWTREVDPMQGEVHTQMSKETMAQLQEASRTLGEDVGAVPGQGEAPLGSAMLVSLRKRFDLAVASKLVRKGLDHWVIRGDLRPGDASEADGLPQPDRVEVVVRALSDGPFAVVRMAQFAAGHEIMAVEIEDVQIDRPMAEASFKLDARGKRVIDVMDHPPAAMQIKDVLDRARRKREADAKGKAPTEEKK